MTLAFTIVMAILLPALGFYVYSRFKSDLSEQIDQSLRSHGDDIAALVARKDLSRSTSLLGREESFAQVLTPSGGIYASTDQLANHPQLTPAEAARAAQASFLITRPHVRSIAGRRGSWRDRRTRAAAPSSSWSRRRSMIATSLCAT